MEGELEYVCEQGREQEGGDNGGDVLVVEQGHELEDVDGCDELEVWHGEEDVLKHVCEQGHEQESGGDVLEVE